MGHFIRLWRIQHDSGLEDGLDKLSHVFCHILLRPPWDKIMYVNIFLLDYPGTFISQIISIFNITSHTIY